MKVIDLAICLCQGSSLSFIAIVTNTNLLNYKNSFQNSYHYKCHGTCWNNYKNNYACKHPYSYHHRNLHKNHHNHKSKNVRNFQNNYLYIPNHNMFQDLPFL